MKRNKVQQRVHQLCCDSVPLTQNRFLARNGPFSQIRSHIVKQLLELIMVRYHLSSVYINLKLFYSYILHTNVITRTHSHFNVITHFLVQCGSEPWSTSVTTSAPTYTPLRVPQWIFKIPLTLVCSSIRRLTKVIFSNTWRCGRTVV